MPTVKKIDGYRFFFFSREGHEPPHIHVDQAEKYAKFWLDPVSMARSQSFRSHQLTKIRELVEENRGLFLEAWHEYFGSEG